MFLGKEICIKLKIWASTLSSKLAIQLGYWIELKSVY